MKTATRPKAPAVAPVWQVWCQRQYDGGQRLYQAYQSEELAAAVAKRLREVGCPCTVRREPSEP